MAAANVNRSWYFTIFVAAWFVSGVNAVEWHNWRQPFYRIAAEMELCSSSPSGMFWDDLFAAPLFDKALLPDSGVYKGNHWVIEPAISAGVPDGHPLYWELEALNDIRYRNLLVRQTLNVDRRYDDDPLFPGHPDRIARGRIEEAYAELDWRYGFVRFGRLLRNWGPFIDRSLLLSSNPYSYDALEWQVHSSLFEFRHLFAAFAQNPHGQFDDNMTGRFFAAHSLNVMFGKWVTFGVTETEIFRRGSGFPDFQYVNPFSVYSVVNTNQEASSGNLMLGFQWNVHPGIENLSLRGQFLLDDFQVDSKLPSDQEPSHWGIDAGVYWRDCLPPIGLRHLLKAGYQRRSEWVYTVEDQNTLRGERYSYLSKSLGLPKNDGDSLWLGFSVVGKNYWVGSATFSYSREGEKDIMSRWHDSDPGNILEVPYDYKAKQFPSGIVQGTIALSLEGMLYFKDYADLRIGLANQWIKNRHHRTSSGFVYAPEFSAALGIHFCDFHVALPR